jgi:hypothetical protein
MIKKEIQSGPNGRVVLMDSIGLVSKEDEGAMVVSSSHGGKSAGEAAGTVPLGAVFFNDAGVGKNNAGICALTMLEEKGIAAGTVSHTSARIGDPLDTWENGIISHLNQKAKILGLKIGEKVRDSIIRVINE